MSLRIPPSSRLARQDLRGGGAPLQDGDPRSWPCRPTAAAGTREGVLPGWHTPAARHTQASTAVESPSEPLTTDLGRRPQRPQTPAPPGSIGRVEHIAT